MKGDANLRIYSGNEPRTTSKLKGRLIASLLVCAAVNGVLVVVGWLRYVQSCLLIQVTN